MTSWLSCRPCSRSRQSSLAAAKSRSAWASVLDLRGAAAGRSKRLYVMIVSREGVIAGGDAVRTQCRVGTDLDAVDGPSDDELVQVVVQVAH